VNDVPITVETPGRATLGGGITASHVALVLQWSVVAAALVANLVAGQWLPSVSLIIGIASVSFISTLIWHLAHSPPPAIARPDLAPIVLPKLGFHRMLWSIVAALVVLFVIGITQHPWVIVLTALSAIAVRVMVAWRSQITRRLVTLGAVAGLVAALASVPITQSGRVGVLLTLVTTSLLFVGGGLLLWHTGLAGIHLLDGDYLAGLGSFAWGCVLALPAALLNILGGGNASDTWVLRWWHPLAAFAPGIAEEIAARLFLTTLCYALLRPTTNDRPRRAVVAAILIGAIVHSLAHLPTVAIVSGHGVTFLIAGLLYGVPMALLFIKRDLEQAIGYHFFVDFVRFLVAFLYV